jgi:hypothetical protein
MEIAPFQYDINDRMLRAVIASIPPSRDKTAGGWGAGFMARFMAGSMVGDPANNDEHHARTHREMPAIVENNKGRVERASDEQFDERNAATR